MEVRWRSRLGSPLAALIPLAATAVICLPGVASGGSWQPPDCSRAAAPSATAAVTRVERPGAPARLVGAPWIRLDPILARDGSLAGQRLSIGRIGRPGTHMLDLPAESTAAGPYGELVATATDDGRRSEVALLDLAAGCRQVLADEPDVVRRVSLDPTGRFLYESRVDRATRGDRGVWRRDLEGGPARRILAPIALDPRFGRTYSTELAWSADGGSLVVESCGAVSCRFRTFDPATSRVDLVADPRLGPLVGSAAGTIVAHGACRGLPCPLVAVKSATGIVRALAPAAGLAALVVGPDGPRLVHERVGPHGGLDVVDVASGKRVRSIDLAAGLRLANPGRSGAGSLVPAGWALLAPDGRSPAAGSVQPLLVDAATGRTTRLPEVTR